MKDVSAAKAGQQDAKNARQEKFLRLLLDSHTIQDAAAQARVGEASVYRGRKTDEKFAREFEKVIRLHRDNKAHVYGRGDLRFDPFQEFPKPPGLEQFRREVFGFPSTPTQRAFCKAYDDKTNLTIFWIAPAGAGKDVTMAQAIAHAAASGIPRMGMLMESQPQAKKRIDAYLDPYFTDPGLYKRAPDIPDGSVPTTSFIDTWGPWKWDKNLLLPDGTRPARTKWEAHAKWFVGRTTPMADPSLWAVGIEGSIAGARVQLMGCSDLFTVENQRSPTQRKEQLDLINGTLDSRLDEGGRLVFLNHHVRRAGESNLVALLDQYIGDAAIAEQDGDYIKYRNGVAVILTPALTLDENNELRSYWPERFPVRETIILGDEHFIAEDLSKEELADLSAKGARRVRGLVERRKRSPELFELIYQQNPRVSGYGDFTTEILDSCDDPDRTLGMYHPTERLIMGVDPARSGGAGWTLWALDSEQETLTLVDYFWADSLGFSGMREKLIREPVMKWRPRDMVWEINYEGETPYHPEAQEVIKRYHVNLIPWRTHYNRGDISVGVVGMLDDMRDHKIRFPASTETDRMRTQVVKDHFQNFEAVGYTERKRTTGSRRLPDDLCMSAWMAWSQAKSMLKHRARKRRHDTMKPTSAVAKAFAGYRL